MPYTSLVLRLPAGRATNEHILDVVTVLPFNLWQSAKRFLPCHHVYAGGRCLTFAPVTIYDHA